MDRIYKIDILKAMCMAQDAWNAMTQETIVHCWCRTGIQKENQPVSINKPAIADPGAWEIVCDHTKSSKMTIPEAQAELQKHLRACYMESDWMETLDAILVAENNVTTALQKVKELAKAIQQVP
ncbi:hypothetical protein B0H17DRAFT_1129435 [Mycena rosella]|uniref:Uncharacterized protein n=1 Tax=Mycena rosella TaxID=1033263 RepID=A0AAD7DVS0_MYCRO|nr:hypothetical protein B0H17DRAFT_1129435 [Mycena rosella]